MHQTFVLLRAKNSRDIDLIMHFFAALFKTFRVQRMTVSKKYFAVSEKGDFEKGSF